MHSFEPRCHKEHWLMQTVSDNMKHHTPAQMSRAKQARNLLHALGSPSIEDLKRAILTNQIKDNPATAEDVRLAEAIFGPDLGALKGKTARRKPTPAVSDQVEVPQETCSNNEDITLCLDVMFVNGMPYMTTVSKNIM